MLPRTRGNTHQRAEQAGGISPLVHSVLAVLSQKNHAPQNCGDGVSTYLALTFGTLLSSQETDASFGNPLRFTSGRFSLSVFPTLPDFPQSVSPDRIKLAGYWNPCSPLGAFRLYQSVFRTVSGPDRNPIPLSAGRLPADHYVSRFPVRLKIEATETEFGHTE